MSVKLHIPGVNDMTTETKNTFALNQWYVAALSTELVDQPLARTLLNQAVVLYRDDSGTVWALDDRCCHRALPLSHGTLEGKAIRCGYHGMLYDGTGQCIDVPGQNTIPKRAKVNSYCIEEKDGLVWIWFGDEGQSEPLNSAPDYPVHTSGEYVWGGGVFYYAAPYQLIHDNLLDLSHLGYVHLLTIGGDPNTHMTADMKTTVDGDCVTVVRHMRDSTPPPTYLAAYPFNDKIDRWQEIEFMPSHLRIWTGGVNIGEGHLDDPNRGGFHMRGFHGVTPETESSAHYIWTIATNPQTDSDAILNKVVDQTALTFEEDKVVIEAQYQNMLKFGNEPMVSIHVDAGATHARRIIEKLRTRA
ncbi:aromatic ring-hydroxylating dioxygenase subunit alpha [Arenicella xantha]|uniref:Vanillate O-demethylase monooxygenase subunit n=1 Tax=Arenicella xantha TaxID=644221 RepID=A0A395JER4_9GAMM|nr:aromatic ring-hydroxylating dioxygenase subunit alpha [Arenicella xantha]RBP47173.1 vanillate O-demethylase monooxygenase subunit [Arenicella xantha]